MADPFTPCRLPAVVDSFVQWCEQTREDFHLETEIDTLLAQRKGKVVVNHTYRQWRAMQKEDPAACRFLGFKDDPEKPDEANLRLEAETFPIWWPGRPMRVRRVLAELAQCARSLLCRRGVPRAKLAATR